MDINDDLLGEDLAELVDIERKAAREDGPSTMDLLADWHKLSDERLRVHEGMRGHGANSQARERLQRLSSVLGGKLARIGDELRSRGIDPHAAGSKANQASPDATTKEHA